MKRRTILAGIAGGSIMAAAGLAYRQSQTQPEIDSKTLSEFSPSDDYDVCIVGTGPAGCTLAQRLSESGKRVLLLESGSDIMDSAGMADSVKLDAYTVSGEKEYPLQGSRLRALGGTSNIWTGRCPRMLPSDFTDNPLAPEGGWPVDYKELQPYYSLAEASLNVIGGKLTAAHAPREEDLPGPPLYDIHELQEVLAPLDIDVDYPPVSHKRHLFKRNGPVRFATDVLPSLSKSENVQLVTQATATKIHLDADGKVSALSVKSVDGTSKSVTADRYVIACGAMESSRLLMLSSDGQSPGGIGDHSGHLGRYFMEHPFKFYAADIPGLEAHSGSHWILGRTYQYSQQMKQAGMGGLLLGFYWLPDEPSRIRIALGIEMAPEAENRIALNQDKPDALGNPGANLQLSFSARDQELWSAGEKVVLDIFKRLKSDDVKKQDTLHWSHHHLGGTRMSESADGGVVDRNLKVHGTDNLYVLSSSVFVTAGVANPTLTIAALAHRLSDHLSRKG